ncbi:hypothetical protein KKC94_03895 [Patescibacteria group bacterium]|nr:hypothetical protein [Patescibacteria group bacterium]
MPSPQEIPEQSTTETAEKEISFHNRMENLKKLLDEAMESKKLNWTKFKAAQREAYLAKKQAHDELIDLSKLKGIDPSPTSGEYVGYRHINPNASEEVKAQMRGGKPLDLTTVSMEEFSSKYYVLTARPLPMKVDFLEEENLFRTFFINEDAMNTGNPDSDKSLDAQVKGFMLGRIKKQFGDLEGLDRTLNELNESLKSQTGGKDVFKTLE